MLSLTGWERFGAAIQRPVIKRWLSEVRGKAQQHFAAGLLGPHTGRVYRRRGGRRHQASVNKTAAEFPANDTGRLLASMKSRQRADEATIGTNVYYAKFLADGTRKMKRRRMSKEALLSGAEDAQPKSRGWVQWARGKQNARSLNK